MKIRIEIDQDIGEEEVVIRCRHFDEKMRQLQNVIADTVSQEQQILFYNNEKEYYFPVKQILFFETGENGIQAHTRDEVFQVRYRLYELEQMLPAVFLRVSKSTILNVEKVYSITRNLTASSVVEFQKTHKKVYVSRNYYKQLKYVLEERKGIKERMNKDEEK